MKGLGSSLAKSMEAEASSVQARVPSFEEKAAKADEALNIAKPKATKTKAPPKPKPKKEKVIRDTFSMPTSDYQLIEELTKRSGMIGALSNKSEVVRAGLKALSMLDDNKLAKALNKVEKVKTGAPKKQS